MCNRDALPFFINMWFLANPYFYRVFEGASRLHLQYIPLFAKPRISHSLAFHHQTAEALFFPSNPAGFYYALLILFDLLYQLPLHIISIGKPQHLYTFILKQMIYENMRLPIAMRIAYSLGLSWEPYAPSSMCVRFWHTIYQSIKKRTLPQPDLPLYSNLNYAILVDIKSLNITFQ